MAETTGIEWTDATFNPWIGCTKVSPACDHCYAEVSAPARVHAIQWGPKAERQRTGEKNWALPLRWEREHAAFFAQHGRRRRVFCASLADVFDNAVNPQWRRDLFNLILSTPSLDWLLLTKRIGNVARMIDETLPESMKALPADCPVAWPWPNVWIGASVTSQEEADRDIPKLLAVPAAMRFLSMEPLLGPVELTRLPHDDGGAIDALAGEIYVEHRLVDADPRCSRCAVGESGRLDWVIVGGESGHQARPMNPDWATSLRDQCAAAGVPFLFKQWGEWGDTDSIELTGLAHTGWHESSREDGGVPRHEWPGPVVRGVELASQRPEVFRVGKKAAGRFLDARLHDGYPERAL